MAQAACGMGMRLRGVTQMREWIAFEPIRARLKHDELRLELLHPGEPGRRGVPLDVDG